MSNLVKARCWC